jgi:hypothetical protein
MIENETKGWHGSYSSIGRMSAEQFPMILLKEQILKGRYKKKKTKDYFSSDDDLIVCDNNNYNKEMIDESNDIFNNHYKVKIKLTKKSKAICKPYPTKKIPDEYKYHNLHHKDNFDQKQKYQINLSSTAYEPKKDFVWSRTVTGPSWKSLCGREKGGMFKSEVEPITPKKKISKNVLKKQKYNTFYSLQKGVSMKKMTQRGEIPTFYDLRIRTDKPYIINSDRKITSVKHNSNLLLNKKEDNYINVNSSGDNSFNQTSAQTFFNFSKNHKLKKNVYSSPNLIHSINFAKNISREQYNYVRRNRDGIKPFFNPKYEFVEPRAVTMVSYNKKAQGKSTPKRLIGIDTHLFFDPDKIINKVNNHKQEKAPLFKNMSDKNDKAGKFPSFMHNIFNRGSLQVITEKGLKMNNYSDVGMKNDYSTFCTKKSFNKVINYGLIKNENNVGNMTNIIKLLKNSDNGIKIKKFMEFYTKNFDDNKVQYTGNKFDSITLKSFKSKENLTNREKKLFCINFID